MINIAKYKYVILGIFSLFLLVGAYVALGSTEVTQLKNNDFQEVLMDLTYDGYSPNVLKIQKDVPVRWTINVKEMTGCTSEIMIESLGIKKDLQIGENVIEFTPPNNVDEIDFSCGMRMVRGKFIVTNNSVAANESEKINKSSSPVNEGCNGNCGSSTCGTSRGGSCGCGKQ